MVLCHNGGNIIAGANNFRNIRYDDLGTVFFEAYTINDCGYSDTVEYQIEIIKKGVKQTDPITSLRTTVYPNPAFIDLNIERTTKNDVINDEPVRYEIYDILLNLKHKGKIREKKSIDISNYEKGFYILKIYFNDKIEIHQIIKE